ncbi:glutamine amidotransferase-related protein [Dapis sp. BLCC M126]|uniref:glutamine amidotransferase-related protein n=1 Tax=Dapis sp. BLCC M126 TaxID=3400189 RepID=UPI003CF582F7
MKKILFVFHKSTTNPGPVAKLIRQRGYQIDVRVISEGNLLPETMDDYEAAISFGGPMSANDSENLPFIRHELDWISTVLSSGKPFFGICLGAQLLARVLGAKVVKHSHGIREIGYHPVQPTSTGSQYFDSDLCFYHWNSEGFEIPAGAIKLASGALFENQAFSYGQNVYGVQFHPEMALETLTEWIETTDPETEKLLNSPGGQLWPQQMQNHLKYAPLVENWLDRFFSIWLV